MHRANLLVSGIVFLLIALLYLWRIFSPFPISIGNFVFPEAASYIGLILFGLLAIWNLTCCCCGKCCCGACKVRHDDCRRDEIRRNEDVRRNDIRKDL
jgi:hypothetical protein